MKKVFVSLVLLLFFTSYGIAQNTSGFTLMSSAQTGIGFSNEVPVFERLNVLISQYHYNGGGVAIGDVNND